MLKFAAPSAAASRSQLYVQHQSEQPDFAAPMTAVALTANWISDLKQINKLLSDGVLVLITPTRRSQDPQEPGASTRPDIVRVGQLEIDLGEHSVRWQDGCLGLSEREIAILACLGQDVGRARSFSELFTRGWGSSCRIDVLVIHSAVQRIRRKLASARVPVTIESVRGYGFRITSTRRVIASAS